MEFSPEYTHVNKIPTLKNLHQNRFKICVDTSYDWLILPPIALKRTTRKHSHPDRIYI